MSGERRGISLVMTSRGCDGWAEPQRMGSYDTGKGQETGHPGWREVRARADGGTRQTLWSHGTFWAAKWVVTGATACQSSHSTTARHWHRAPQGSEGDLEHPSLSLQTSPWPLAFPEQLSCIWVLTVPSRDWGG